ncbi:MAG TPA: sigma-70 family RNA polymerase sigma factor [Sphingobacteriaceae bacterium]|nr:sigma-70 family RNA polymerase sigma factor [Sphingobacteriaceae bacterium]
MQLFYIPVSECKYHHAVNSDKQSDTRSGDGKLKVVILPEEILIDNLINKRRSGYEALYHMYSASLYGVIFRIIKNQEIAEEVLQDTFVRICDRCQSYEITKGRFFTWIVNIARNLAIDMLRTKNFKKSLISDSIDERVELINSERNFSINIETIDLQQLINALEPKYRLVLDLMYFQGYTHTEVAEALNLPLGTIKTRLRSAISKLRRRYN